MDGRFVVQEHTTSDAVHWDLMIEQGDTLTTFRLAEGPEQALHHPVQAVRILDHPLRFLTYEGPVQKGTGRVRIVDRGTYALHHETAEALTLDLHGGLLRGTFVLAQKEGTTWELASTG